jgi:hypothetical protein
MPSIAINHLGNAILPSMFGAGLMMPERASTTLQDVGPTPVPVFSSIQEAVAKGIPELDAGIMGPGLRLGEDSMVTLSPAMIREFCAPAFAQVNQHLGGSGHIHFCSLPHYRFEHIYPALLPVSEVAVVSSQFGFEYYEQHLDELRGRLAMEALYGDDAMQYVSRKYGSFQDWANYFVPRYKNESGLVFYFQVDSLEEGREVWTSWQEAHQV